jgi:hypothetical protein
MIQKAANVNASLILFRKGIGASASLLQEAVLPLSGSDASAVSDGDAKFLDASVAALRAYQNDLEGAVNVLASQGSEGTSLWMSDCLKTMDALHTTMALHNEVMQHAYQISTARLPSHHPCLAVLQLVALGSDLISVPEPKCRIYKWQVMEARRTPSTAPEQQQQSDSQNLLPGFDSHESGPQARWVDSPSSRSVCV